MVSDNNALIASPASNTTVGRRPLGDHKKAATNSGSITTSSGATTNRPVINDPNRILNPSSRPKVVLTRNAVSQLYPEMAKSRTTRNTKSHAASGAAPPGSSTGLVRSTTRESFAS